MIFYFSATGNSKWAAEKLADLVADRICDITTMGDHPEYSLKAGAWLESAKDSKGISGKADAYPLFSNHLHLCFLHGRRQCGRDDDAFCRTNQGERDASQCFFLYYYA